jgi:hypothetical protein
MAQHDYVIANGTGAAVRSDLNNALAAIVSQNSGATEPSTTYAYMPWADSTTGLYKIRNAANNGWITLFQLDGEWSTIALENGTAGAPSIYFKDSGTDTGIYSPGTDQVAISTGGTGRLFVDSSGRVGLGTSAPSEQFHVANADDAVVLIESTGTDSTDDARLELKTTNGTFSIQNDRSLGTSGVLTFAGNTSNNLCIDHSTGRVGIGTTGPSSLLHVTGGSGQLVEFGTGNSLRIGGFGTGNCYVKGNETTVSFGNVNAGNTAFLTGDTERARIDSSGRLLVGTSSDFDGYLNQVSSTSGTLLSLRRTNSNPGSIKLSSGASGDNVVNGSQLGYFRWYGFHTSTDYEAARISAEVDGTPGANDMPGRLVFSTTADGASSPTERMRITQGGNVGIGVTPTYRFDVAGSAANSYIGFHENTANTADDNMYLWRMGANANSASANFLYCQTSTTQRFGLRGNGGLANYSANNVNLSDRNVKKDIAPVSDTWDCIKEWEIVNFRYKDQPDDADLNMGVIAQQVAESCPEVITVFQEAKEATETEPAQEERIGVKEQQMMWMAIKALQEAQLRIETLEAKVAAFEAS